VNSEDALIAGRMTRLRNQMAATNVPAILTADPINIAYATGARNMSIYSMMGAVRFLLVVADGPAVLWEFPGSEHLADGNPQLDEVRAAPGITALAGTDYRDHIAVFAKEVAALCRPHPGSARLLAVERFDHPVTDELRSSGLELLDGTTTFAAARMIKTTAEVEVMREAMRRVLEGVEVMRASIVPGKSEIEIWAEFQRHLIAHEGEYVSTRLVQAGPRTFPYFQEASSARLGNGDLFSIDTDAIGYGGYGVDFSRTFLCGSADPTPAQRVLHSMAREQLEHNASQLEVGRSFESFSRSAWKLPDEFAPYRYSCLAHGLGMSGEHPYVPAIAADGTFSLDGEFEAGMVICVESYIGDADTRQGIKLEDQFLVRDDGIERMSETPFDERLSG